MASKKCKFCEKMKSTFDFPRSKAKWFVDGLGDICFDCMEKIYDATDLNSVDHILQYLDIQFDPDDWTQVYGLSSSTVLQTYTTKHYSQKASRGLDWKQANDVWREKRENGTMQKQVKLLSQQWLTAMRKRWGAYTAEQYETLQSFYDNIDHTQNILTAIQQDQAQNMCRLSLVIRSKIQRGEDASKEIKSYNDYIKSAGFQPKNARNYGDFQSVGQLINFLVKKGYKPTFYHQKPQQRDLVDLTIKNNQAYLRRLVHNQPGLGQLVQQRKNGYKVAQQLQQQGSTDYSLDKYDAASAKLDYEGSKEDLQEALNDGQCS